ncbi:MetQ/NlpA family ABC transporter substrate-binding protein [Pediococcus argentinicus]|uniref:MetQ/NlpA family ABC transporter substrate-binding protein n=1 Tax=Pediococcus argentinicus TaxID=480391 RepID=UPI00338E8480
MKKSYLYILGTLAVVALIIVGIHNVGNFVRHHQAESAPITIGSVGSDYDIWQHIAQSPEAKKAGLNLKVKEVTDSVQLNKGTAQGNIDVNAFQSWSYFEAYNKDNPSNQLGAIGTTYLEPMGIYSKKYKDVNDIPDGATIAFPNDPAGTARSLLLLQSAGLIKVKKNLGALGNIDQIAENPKHLKFKQIDDHTGPRVLGQVDAVLISNTVALTGHLHVLSDSIFHEKVNQSTKNNINILATAKGSVDNPKYKKLVALYHNKDIQKWIAKKYFGTKIEVQKPINDLK